MYLNNNGILHLKLTNLGLFGEKLYSEEALSSVYPHIKKNSR